MDLQQALHQSIFMPSLASNPTHRLHLFWEQHCRLLPEVSGLTAKQVAKWTVEEVSGLFPAPLSRDAGMPEHSSSGVLIGRHLYFLPSPRQCSSVCCACVHFQGTQLEVKPKTLYLAGEVPPLILWYPQLIALKRISSLLPPSLPLFIYPSISQSSGLKHHSDSRFPSLISLPLSCDFAADSLLQCR